MNYVYWSGGIMLLFLVLIGGIPAFLAWLADRTFWRGRRRD